MSGLELNKIVAAILIASLIAMLAGIVANVLYKPKLNIAERGYQVEVSDSSEAASVVKTEKQVDIKELMATASAADGAQVVKKCLSCHTLEEGAPNKIGPNLWKVYGSAKGKRDDGYIYSKALASASGIWDDEDLYHFLNKPSAFLPGTKMSFAGLSKPQDIVNVIAYLKEKAS